MSRYGYQSQYGYDAGYPKGGSVPFSPDQIPGQILWLDAGQIAGADGASISAVSDLSPAQNDFENLGSSTFPTLQTNEINGHPVLRFTVGSVLHSVAGSIPADAAVSVYLVLKNIGTAVGFVFWAADGTHYIVSESPAGQISQNAGGSTSNLSATSTAAFQIVKTTTFVTSAGQWILGSRTLAGADGWGGDLAEMLVYESALSAGNDAAVTAYLAAKYGL